MNKVIVVAFLVVIGWLFSEVFMSMYSDNRVMSYATLMDLRQYENALLRYNDDIGGFPSKESGLHALVNSLDKGDKPYLKQITKDPWGRDYLYIVDESGRAYVSTLGKDGAVGGEGLNVDQSIHVDMRQSSR